MIAWKRYVLAVLAGFGLPSLVLSQTPPAAAPGMEPGRLAVRPGQPAVPPENAGLNQRMAEAIAEHLRHSGRLCHYQVNVVCHEGIVDLSGQVADAGQRDEVLRLVHGMPGVAWVRENLVVVNGAAAGGNLRPTQAEGGPKLEQAPPPNKVPDGPLPEPLPIFQAPAGGAAFNPNVQPPRMPPYAWPTYAPYNNYSRVAYPTLYPYSAWPFIGPFNPFPKIPPGWRSVELRWMDGYWWYGRTATGHDWWRVRYR